MMFPYKRYKLYMDTLYIGLRQLNFPDTKAILLESLTSNPVSHRRVLFSLKMTASTVPK